ncbi:rhomboid family intramembrane serine protease [Planotetraspora sp. GP83]|uniref:rhomboid family intramembrane serine protease n=1 Tax=Planotetraspora sp. GP83 TaxID=3156264 RepID=UPI00351754A0
MKIQPLPRVTVIVFLITAVPSLLQLFSPSLLTTFERDPSLVGSGEWWRLATSLVVQDGGLIGTAFNLVSLAGLGLLAERALGPARWLALYLAGAVAGQVAGMLSGAPGAGNSIAVCGLAGGLLAAFALARADRLAGSVAAFYSVVILTTAFGHSTAGLIATVAVATAGTQLIAHRDRLPRWVFPLPGLAAGVVLSALGDLHGPPLLAGLVIGAVLARAGSPSPKVRTAG